MTIDRYDHRGRLLDEPDDDEACVQHGNRKDSCQACIADFEREEAEYLAWRSTQPAPMTIAPDDLPY